MHRKDKRLTEGQRTGKSRRLRLKNKPPEGETWVWVTQEMLNSPAWRYLSGNAQKIVSRLIVEHLTHAGTKNGNLICTYSDFESYGIRRNSIAVAIREAENAGWIKVTKGWAYRGHREPSVYRLTWLPENWHYPTNDWRFATKASMKAFKKDVSNTRRMKAARKKRTAQVNSGENTLPTSADEVVD